MASSRLSHRWIISALAVMLLAGCAGSPNNPLPVTGTDEPATELQLDNYFQGFAGAFVLYDRNNDRYVRYHPGRCAERFLPASTFKIMNALIGLETGVIPDENYVIKWDGTRYDTPAWNRDHTLKTAMQDSVVWYYQEVARRVGKDRMQSNIDAAEYGNQEIAGEIDSFWLDGTLRISADEQVEFLKRLYVGELPFSQRSMTIVQNILVLEETDAYRLHGKTGSGWADGLYVGWFVGFLEEKDNAYFFATNLQSSSPEARGTNAKEITLKILHELE